MSLSLSAAPSMKDSAVVVHFYRAIVMHADVWRQRLDATTNWAVVTNVGVISFSFTRPESPHFLLLLLSIASCIFLIMESRRYQIYDLWRRRIRTVHRFVVAPFLSPGYGPSQDKIDEELNLLAQDLGRMVPHLAFIDALGYRIRRNYGYLFFFSIGSWVLKIFLHPKEARSTGEILDRAAIGGLAGIPVITFVAVGSFMILFLALRAPSEQMLKWRELPSPWRRLVGALFFRRRVTEEEEETRWDPDP
jgi:uncharacterized membrane protein